jgi:hypothetical protein
MSYNPYPFKNQLNIGEMIPPDDNDFAWINQGGASTSFSPYAVTLDVNAVAGDSCRIRKKAAPSTPYTIACGFVPEMRDVSAYFPGMGLLMRESGTSKFVALNYTLNTQPYPRMQKWTNETTFSAGYASDGDYPYPYFGTGQIVWFAMEDDGAASSSLRFYLSNDGVYYTRIFEVSRTGFLAGGPDEVGFFANANSAFGGCVMHLVHWQEYSSVLGASLSLIQY